MAQRARKCYQILARGVVEVSGDLPPFLILQLYQPSGKFSDSFCRPLALGDVFTDCQQTLLTGYLDELRRIELETNIARLCPYPNLTIHDPAVFLYFLDHRRPVLRVHPEA